MIDHKWSSQGVITNCTWVTVNNEYYCNLKSLFIGNSILKASLHGAFYLVSGSQIKAHELIKMHQRQKKNSIAM